VYTSCCCHSHALLALVHTGVNSAVCIADPMAATTPRAPPTRTRAARSRRRRGFSPGSRSTSCVNGVCTTTVCGPDGECTTTMGSGGSVTLTSRVPRTPSGRGSTRSRSCVNNVCTTTVCDAAGECSTIRDGSGEDGEDDEPERGPGGTAARPPLSSALPSNGPVVSRSRSCSNGVCTTTECDAQGNCQTSRDDEEPPLPPGTPPSDPEDPQPSAGPSEIGPVVSRSRSCSNGGCTTTECDAQGNCRTAETTVGGPPLDTAAPSGPPGTPSPSRGSTSSSVRGTVTASANGTTTDIQVQYPRRCQPGPPEPQPLHAPLPHKTPLS